MKILGLILARGGSQRLPGKNIKMLEGKPLIAWTIQSALNTPSIDKVLVSTDSTEIQETAIRFGAHAPFLRPATLAHDSATSFDAALHALNWAEEHWGHFDALVLLEPTSPLRKKEDLENGIQLFKERYSEIEGVASLGRVGLENPIHMKRVVEGFIEPIEIKGSADYADKYYFPYGVMYLIKTSVFREKKTFYGDRLLPLFIERWQNYEVDDEFDFSCIEAIMKMKKNEVML